MFEKSRFGVTLIPIVTPFGEDQEVDYDAMVSIGEKLIAEKKADTLILTGTTGEFFTMTYEERVKVLKLMKSTFGGRIPLIAGTGSASTKEAIALTKEAESLGYDTVMVVAPYYTKPTQAEILNHFKKIAAQVSLDIMMYNIPIFTGVNIDPESVRELSGIKNIVAIKEEAELNPKQMTSYLNVTPDDFIVYCGDDTMTLEALVQGGDRIGGFVSGAAHLIGNELKVMVDSLKSGDYLKAAELQRSFFPLYRSMGGNGRTNPVSLLKDAMRMTGFNSGYPRLPLTPGTPDEIEMVRAELKRLNLV